MTRRVLKADVSGGPRLGWMDGWPKYMSLAAEGYGLLWRLCDNAKDRKEWRAILRMRIEFNSAIFAWPCIL